MGRGFPLSQPGRVSVPDAVRLSERTSPLWRGRMSHEAECHATGSTSSLSDRGLFLEQSRIGGPDRVRHEACLTLAAR